MVMKRLILLALLIGFCLNNKTQAESKMDSNELRHASFHLSLVSPLSTNGMQSLKTVNDFSLNMIYGHSAGVSGFEVGAFVNLNKHFVKGVQLGGFSNVNLGTTNGVQTSGFANYGEKKAKGVQLGGFANINTAEVSGLQASGFLNYAGGKMDGVQVAGFLNMAKGVKGTQIGFLNYADSFESGLPIGFLSVVKNGYNHVEVWGSETFQGNVSAKFGVANFYNIFSVGKRFGGDSDLWGLGYGIGAYWPFNDQWGMNTDLLTYDVNKGSDLTDETVLLNTLKVNANYKAGEFEIFAGPTVNLLVLDQEANQTGEDRPIGEELGPYSLEESTNNGKLFKGWIGGSIGIRY